MSNRVRHALTVLTWTAVAAVAVCQAVFPAFLHFMAIYAPWPMGLATGWLWHGMRDRARRKTPS